MALDNFEDIETVRPIRDFSDATTVFTFRNNDQTTSNIPASRLRSDGWDIRYSDSKAVIQRDTTTISFTDQDGVFVSDILLLPNHVDDNDDSVPSNSGQATTNVSFMYRPNPPPVPPTSNGPSFDGSCFPQMNNALAAGNEQYFAMMKSYVNEDISSFDFITDVIDNAPDLHGNVDFTSELREDSALSSGYIQQSQRMEAFFFKCLSKHPYLSSLADFIENPVTKKRQRRFYYYCTYTSPHQRQEVMNIVNTCVLHMSLHLKMKNGKPYQPNTVAYRVRMLFSIFKKNGILIQSREFRGRVGSYHAYWRTSFSESAQQDSSFGTRPNRAPVDEEMDDKIRSTPALDPYNNYNTVFGWLLLV